MLDSDTLISTIFSLIMTADTGAHVIGYCFEYEPILMIRHKMNYTVLRFEFWRFVLKYVVSYKMLDYRKYR